MLSKYKVCVSGDNVSEVILNFWPGARTPDSFSTIISPVTLSPAR